MENILSIDVESWLYFYHDALKEPTRQSSIERKRLDDGYVRESISRLLELLKKKKQRATFFVVAEIYDWYPDAIEAIERSGHEVGYHTYQHVVLTDEKLLEEELQQSTRFLERFRPMGFRAPQIVINADAYPLLKRHGFVYSSSTYDTPGKRIIAGVDEIPVSTVFWRKSTKDLFENPHQFPKNLTLQLISRAWPVGSGLSLALGTAAMTTMIAALNREQRAPVVLFVHPWQLFDHPKIRGAAFFLRVLQRNPLCLPYLKNVFRTLDRLLDRFTFVSCREYYYG